jgi:hypothetical protein
VEVLQQYKHLLDSRLKDKINYNITKKKDKQVEIDFGSSQNINYVVLQEDIKHGQRIKSFTIDAWFNGK